MPESACFVAQIDPSLHAELKKNLQEFGFEFNFPPYTVFQAKKKGISCTLYQSGKFVVQGKEKDDFIAFYLEPKILKSFNFSYPDLKVDKTPHIGVDEAGKGDLFGPLCIAALYGDEKDISKLINMGIKDSKRYNDTTILSLAKKLKASFIYSLVTIFPEKYNALYEQFRNLNHLLGWGHATAIENVLKKISCKKVIIDKFADEKVVASALAKKKIELNLLQRHRGEEDIIVAGASILARSAFIEGLDKLSKTFDLTLPKGATSLVIDFGRRFVNKHGRSLLPKIAKMHFKTINTIVQGPKEI